MTDKAVIGLVFSFYFVVELTLRESPRECFVSGFYLEAISVDCIKGFFMIAVDVKSF